MYKVGLFELPGFSNHNRDKLEQLFFENHTALQFYAQFTHKIFNAIEGKSFLPVMRLCDGEYIFCVGEKRNTNAGPWRLLKFYVGKLLKKQTTTWGENYSKKQKNDLKNKFTILIKQIAENGFLANHFVYSPSHFSEEYIQPMQKWFAKNEIHLNSSNYTSFYFVYVLLNGPNSLQLFKGRNILVLSSFEEGKCRAVESELKRRGTSTVFFKTISKTQSMLDKLNLTEFEGKVDLALIAGGIGSANILMQCKSLNIVCIDSGFALECMADSEKRKERKFCMPDKEF